MCFTANGDNKTCGSVVVLEMVGRTVQRELGATAMRSRKCCANFSLCECKKCLLNYVHLELSAVVIVHVLCIFCILCWFDIQ